MLLNRDFLFIAMAQDVESWNMADATLKRFDNILKQSSYLSQTGRLEEWKRNLMDLRRNLFPFMTQTEFDDATKRFNSLPKLWVYPNGKLNPKTSAKVNQIFDDMYMMFLTIMKKKGLLMPKTVDSGKAVIEM